MEVSVSDKIRQNYIEYASVVNSSRSLPLCYDGLKIVQRRILLTGVKIAQNKLAKSATIIGECMANYHPHGDASIYGALVGMVRDPYPMFEGQGNWGDDETNAAAYRYTSARLTELAKSYYVPFINFSPLVENDLGHQENLFIPTKLPYALINGTSGIGLGVSTVVPAFSLDSVLKYVEWMRSPSTSEPELRLDYPLYEMNDSCLKTGEGRVRYKLVYRPLDEKSFVIERKLPNTDTKLLITKLFSTEIDSRKVFLRDESGPAGTRYVVGKVRWISVDSIESKLRSVEKSVSVSMNWSTGSEKPLVRLLSPKSVLEISLEAFYQAVEKWRSHEISKIDVEIKFQELKIGIMQALVAGKSWSQISEEFSLSKDELSYIRNKSLNQLSESSEEKIKELKSERLLIESKSF